MSKQYDVVVYRGRFQGFHNAHLKTILMALQFAKKVIVVVGSANEARTYYRNPFFEDERIEMIKGALSDHFRHEDVSFVSVQDNPSDSAWAEDVENKVATRVSRLFEGTEGVVSIAQIGFKKDANCERDVNLFPNWEYIDTPNFEPLDATHVREVLFSMKPLSFLAGVCPHSVIQYLEGFRQSQTWLNMFEEKVFVENYQKQFAGLPYAPTFVTGDNVAIQRGRVLLVKRKGHPGKGLWALPAGFFNAAKYVNGKGEIVPADRDPFDCATRELFEETNAKVTRIELEMRAIAKEVFAAEGRDPRGRIITHAFAYNLDTLPDLETEAADDAEELGWFFLSDLDPHTIYADHYQIIKWGFQEYYKISNWTLQDRLNRI
jgi:bifunctional NMN adenylyltransferase/nudix hydrolase